jgi:regulator of replication initiation timing
MVRSKDKKIEELVQDLDIMDLENQKIKIELQKQNLEKQKHQREILKLKKQVESLKKGKRTRKKGKFDLIKEQNPMGKYSYLHKNKYL